MIDHEYLFTLPEDLEYLIPPDEILNQIGRQAVAFGLMFAFNMHPDAFEKPQPPPAPIDRIRVTTGRLNIRTGPGLSYSVYDILLEGDERVVYSTVEQDDGVIWYGLSQGNESPKWVHGAYVEKIT